jgi:hypothetical protein
MRPRYVVSLCDLTGNMVRPWAAAGHACICYDIQHKIRLDRVEGVGSGSITYRWANVRSLTAEDLGDPCIVFAFPPCTNLAGSGARDRQRKGLRGLIDGLELVEACRQLCENSRAPWMLENPVGWLSSHWRAPDHYFDPWQFTELEPADNYTKRTCLWMGGGFVMPAPRPLAGLPAPDDRIHKASPTTSRGNIRSATPLGFAHAVQQANDRDSQQQEVA